MCLHKQIIGTGTYLKRPRPSPLVLWLIWGKALLKLATLSARLTNTALNSLGHGSQWNTACRCVTAVRHEMTFSFVFALYPLRVILFSTRYNSLLDSASSVSYRYYFIAWIILFLFCSCGWRTQCIKPSMIYWNVYRYVSLLYILLRHTYFSWCKTYYTTVYDAENVIAIHDTQVKSCL